MPMNRIQRLAAAIAAAGAISAASTGITYAATANHSVYGCTNSHSTQSSDGYWVNNSVIHDLPIGPGLVAYEQDGAKSGASELVDKAANINADLLVARNGKSFTLRVVLMQNAEDCLALAQATPST